MQRLIAMTRPDEMKAAGLPFETTDSARWAHRQRHENGTAGAFIQLGRRWYIDPDRFHALIRSRQAA
jgi:Rad3-related DNA helicase